MVLTKRDRSVLLLSLGIAVEHTCRAIDNCREGWERSAAVRQALSEHERTLQQLEEIRERLIRGQDASLD